MTKSEFEELAANQPRDAINWLFVALAAQVEALERSIEAESQRVDALEQGMAAMDQRVAALETPAVPA